MCLKYDLSLVREREILDFSKKKRCIWEISPTAQNCPVAMTEEGNNFNANVSNIGKQWVKVLFPRLQGVLGSEIVLLPVITPDRSLFFQQMIDDMSAATMICSSISLSFSFFPFLSLPCLPLPLSYLAFSCLFLPCIFLPHLPLPFLAFLCRALPRLALPLPLPLPLPFSQKFQSGRGWAAGLVTGVTLGHTHGQGAVQWAEGHYTAAAFLCFY